MHAHTLAFIPVFGIQLLQAVTGQNASTASAANVVIVLCGVAKMFVGELVENGESSANTLIRLLTFVMKQACHHYTLNQ